MLIAVISDTHLSEPDARLERIFAQHLAQADAVLHCGDTTSRSTWSFLARRPNFHAVAGNMDDWGLTRDLPLRLSLRLGPLRVGLTHGNGLSGRPLSRAVAESFGPGFDLLCFGHTHFPEHAAYGSAQVLNPGALAGREPDPTLALVRAAPDKTIQVEFVRVGR